MRKPTTNSLRSRQIAEEQSRCFRGTASIRCDCLTFESGKVQRDHVERLKVAFGAGCFPAKAEHQIPALIDVEQLKKVLEGQGASEEDLRKGFEPLKLEFPPSFQLLCLQGHHRVAAARQLNPPVERWVVRLFDSGTCDIKEPAERDLRDHQTISRAIEDGEFYYNIQLHRGIFGGKRNSQEATRLWANLDSQKGKGASGISSKGEGLRQLINNGDYAPVFNSFHKIPAIYTGLRLTLVNKLIPMDCRDELISSLEDVRTFWEAALGGEDDLMKRLDSSSVTALKSKAPGAFRNDRDGLETSVASGEILGEFNGTERERIWANICAQTQSRLIPSLWEFFDNLNYVGKVAACMKSIVEVDGHSWRSSLLRSFHPSDSGRFIIQVEPGRYHSIPPQGSNEFELAYRQLWLYLFRSYKLMQPAPRMKLAGLELTETSDLELLGFAKLAHMLGFRSYHIQHLLHKDPFTSMARRFVRKAKPPGYCQSVQYEQCISIVARQCEHAWTPSANGLEIDEDDSECDLNDGIPTKRPGRVSGIRGQAERPKRSGLPLRSDYQRYQSQAFLHHMHGASTVQASESFFIQRSLYQGLFASWPVSTDVAGLLADSPRQVDEWFFESARVATEERDEDQYQTERQYPAQQLGIKHDELTSQAQAPVSTVSEPTKNKVIFEAEKSKRDRRLAKQRRIEHWKQISDRQNIRDEIRRSREEKAILEVDVSNLKAELESLRQQIGEKVAEVGNLAHDVERLSMQKQTLLDENANTREQLDGDGSDQRIEGEEALFSLVSSECSTVGADDGERHESNQVDKEQRDEILMDQPDPLYCAQGPDVKTIEIEDPDGAIKERALGRNEYVALSKAWSNEGIICLDHRNRMLSTQTGFGRLRESNRKYIIRQIRAQRLEDKGMDSHQTEDRPSKRRRPGKDYSASYGVFSGCTPHDEPEEVYNFDSIFLSRINIAVLTTLDNKAKQATFYVITNATTTSLDKRARKGTNGIYDTFGS